MVLTGAGELAVQVMNQMINSYKTAKPEIPEKIWQDVMKEIKVDELNNLVIPIYDKYLAHDEIKEMIKFYESPLGKKLISIMPRIAQESMLVGQQWGRELGTKVGRKLQEQGYQ